MATDVITNGAFDTDITTGWSNLSSGQVGATNWDNSVGGIANGSVRHTATGRNKSWNGVLSQDILTTINAADEVRLSLYWYKTAAAVAPTSHIMIVRIIRPAGDSVDVWTESSIPNAEQVLSGTLTDSLISGHFNQTGSYTIRLIGDLQNGNSADAVTQANFDDIVLDVITVANQAPTLTAGTTSPTPTSVNRIGANTTTLSADFSDADVPGVGTFIVTFKIVEPDMLPSRSSNPTT
jgi:hypothetical protein